MTIVAITGHRQLPASTRQLVDVALRTKLHRQASKLIGVSCLADGADALFAQAVLDCGGSLITIIPAEKYRDELPENHHDVYDALLSQASEIIRLSHVESDPEAHMDASLRMIGLADELLAVWDGQPAAGPGGTADVVHAAQESGVPVTVVWPDGAYREAG